MSSHVPPVVGSHALYHKNLQEIDSLILDLREYSSLLTAEHKLQLAKLGGDKAPEPMTIDDVQQQFILVKKIRDQIIDGEGGLLEGADLRALTALTSALNSLISLFLKNQNTFDHIKEYEDMKAAVIHAVSGLDREARDRFFEKLDELGSKINQAG